MSEGASTDGQRLRIPVNAEGRRGWQRRLGGMAILAHLGTELDLDDEHLVRLHLRHPTLAHQGGVGTAALNGAMISGMIDCAMSVAGILHFRGRSCGTVQLSIQFMKPVRSPHPTVECHAVRRSASMVFLEARLVERDGRASVTASGVVGLSRLQQAGQAGAAGADHANWLAPAGLAVAT